MSAVRHVATVRRDDHAIARAPYDGDHALGELIGSALQTLRDGGPPHAHVELTLVLEALSQSAPVVAPMWPEDFVQEYADGGATFWYWSPYGDPPRWSVGSAPPDMLSIGDEETTSHELVPGQVTVVMWQGSDGREIQRRAIYHSDADLQAAVDEVMREAYP